MRHQLHWRRRLQPGGREGHMGGRLSVASWRVWPLIGQDGRLLTGGGDVVWLGLLV